MAEQQIDLTKIKPVIGGKVVDLAKYDRQVTKIELAEVTQVTSVYTPLIPGTQQHYMQWVLKVSSEVLETIDVDGEKISFRATEMFSLIQDDKGNLTGFPTGEKAKLMLFMKDLKVKDPEKLTDLKQVIDNLVGKSASIQSYDKIKDNQKKTYLKFRY